MAETAFKIALGLTGFYLVLWGMNQPPKLPHLQLAGFLLLFLAAEALLTLVVIVMKNGLDDVTAVAEAGEGGGYLGGGIVWLLSQGVGQLGATFLLLIAGIVAVILTTGVSRDDMGIFLRDVFTRKEAPPAEREIAKTLERLICSMRFQSASVILVECALV